MTHGFLNVTSEGTARCKQIVRSNAKERGLGKLYLTQITQIAEIYFFNEHEFHKSNE